MVAPSDTHPPVRLLIAYLAWRHRTGDKLGGSPRDPGPACRFLSPDEPLRLVGRGLVMDAWRRVWMCPESFLAEPE